MSLTSQQVLEEFSNDDLVSHSYLDSSLPKCEEKNISQLQSAASQLLSQLDYHSQDLTWTLDALVTKLTQSSNKIKYQIELLTGDLDSLKTKVDSNHTDSMSETEVMKQLQKYDQARRQMEKVILTLREAKEFDQTKFDAEVDQLLYSNNDPEGAMSKVDHALELCQVWKGTAAYSGRVKAIVATKRKVEKESKPVTLNATPEPTSTGVVADSGTSTKESSPMPESGYGFFGELSRRMGYN